MPACHCVLFAGDDILPRGSWSGLFETVSSSILFNASVPPPLNSWAGLFAAPFLLDPGKFIPCGSAKAPIGEVQVGKKLYVGNLSYGVSSSDLQTLFAQYGNVQSAQVIEDRETGRSKGFGFVEMGSDEEAQSAISGLNGQSHDGRPLTVNEAKPREDRGGGGGGFRGGRGGGGGGYGGGGGGGRGGRSRY